MEKTITVKPAVPIVIRMNGEIEAFNVNTTVLKKERAFSDIIVTRSYYNSLTIEGKSWRYLRVKEEEISFTLTPQQFGVLLRIMTYEFSK